MFENIMKFFKKLGKTEQKTDNSKDTAKERLHLVLMQDRAHVSADFLELMKQEIIEVIKKYIDVDENAIDVRLTNKANEDGTNGAPSLYANIPILNIKDEMKKEKSKEDEIEKKPEIVSDKNVEKEDNKEESVSKKNEDIEKADEKREKKEIASNEEKEESKESKEIQEEKEEKNPAK